jgi:hypothetical protein
MGTGKPPVHVNGTPRVWLDDRVARKYPQWFTEVMLEAPTQNPRPDIQLKDGGLAELIDVDAVMVEANKIRRKARLAEFGEKFGVSLPVTETLESMKCELVAELMRLNEI